MPPHPQKPPRPILDTILLSTSKLRMTREAAVHVYGVGTLGRSDEARVKLGGIIGVRIDGTIPKALSAAHAQVVNEKLSNTPKTVLVRVTWRWTTTERGLSLTKPEGIIQGFEVVRQTNLGANAEPV